MIDLHVYRSARAQGTPAAQACRQAQPVAPGLFEWDDLDDSRTRYPVFLRAVRTLEGGTLTVELVGDDEGWSLEDRTMVEWCERRSRYDDYRDARDTGERTRRECFLRTVDTRDGTLVGDYTEVFGELLAHYHRTGSSRAVAWERAVAGVESQVDYARELVRGDRAPFGVTATFRDPAGHEIGYAGVWGFDYDVWNPREQDALLSEVNEIASEAVAMAQTRVLVR